MFYQGITWVSKECPTSSYGSPSGEVIKSRAHIELCFDFEAAGAARYRLIVLTMALMTL